MPSSTLKELAAFLMVAEEANFTRAAARLGVSQSALSQVIRTLESRLELRLFTRTTRSVALTEAGEQLRALVGPAMDEIEAGLAKVGELRGQPAGTLRLNADEFAIHNVLMPAIAPLVAHYPDIRVELATDFGRTDIVSGGFDAGVRRGGLVARDMIAMRISPPIPMSVVAAPEYLARHFVPQTPQQLVDLHCMSLRLSAHGEIYAWTFTRDGRDQRVKPEGQVVVTTIAAMREAALLGIGLAYLPLHHARPWLESGQLVEVLADWRKTYEPYHLYYPNRRLSSPAFSLLLQALRDNLGRLEQAAAATEVPAPKATRRRRKDG